MPALFVPEERWAPRSWGVNHPLTVQAQIYHGLKEAGYGYWGFSPSNKPEGGYGVYGVDGIGMDPDGKPSNEDKTLIDHGFEGCPDRPAEARSAAVGVHERRRHAARLVPRAALRAATRRATTCAASRATSPASTAGGASATASTSTPGASRAPTCRSTRG